MSFPGSVWQEIKKEEERRRQALMAPALPALSAPNAPAPNVGGLGGMQSQNIPTQTTQPAPKSALGGIEPSSNSNNSGSIWQQLKAGQKGGMDAPSSPMFKRTATLRANKQADRAFLERQLPVGGEIKQDEAPFGKQFQMGRLDSDEEIVNYIRNPENKVIPEGATGGIIKTRSGQSIPGYILQDDPNFYAVNAQGPSGGDVGYAAGKILNLENLAGLATSFIPVVGPEMAAASRFGAIPALKRLGIEIIGNVLGRGADELTDVATGAQEDASKIPGKMLESGVGTLITTPISMGGQRLANTVRGARAVPPTIENQAARQELVRASQDLGAPSPNLGDLNVSDAARRVNIVNRIVNPRAAAREETRRGAVLNSLQKSIQEDVQAGRIPVDAEGRIDASAFANNVTDEQLHKLANQYQAQVNQELRAKLSSKGVQGGVTQEKGGAAILDGMYAPGGYNDIKTIDVKKQYENAKRVAVESKAEYSFTDLSSTIRKNMPKGEFIDEDGNLIKMEMVDDPQVRGIAKTMLGFAENQSQGKRAFSRYTGGGKFQPEEFRDPARVMESAINLRSKLFDLSQPDPITGTLDVNKRAAQAMHSMLTEFLENPKSYQGDVNPGELWRAANNAHKEKMDTLTAFKLGDLKDKGVLGRGEQAYQQLRPDMGNMTNAHLDTLQRIMNKENFDLFKRSYYEDILAHPQQLAKRLDTLSPAERSLLPLDVRDMIKQYARQMDKIDQTMVAKRLNTLEDNTTRVKKILAETPAADVSKVLADLKIPEDAYRINVMQGVIRDSSRVVRGKLTMNPAKFQDAVEKVKESGHFKNLTPTQQKLLSDGALFSSWIKATADVATALNAGAIQAGRVEFQNPVKMAWARAEARAYAVLGWISERPSLVNRALQAPEYKDYAGLRAGINLAGDVVTAFEREKTKPQLEEFRGVKY